MRYSRQEKFYSIGKAGQEKLGKSTVVIAGCGALGSTIADMTARAGVGKIILLDRDFVEWSNLARQSLYTEDDAKNSIPKAIALKNHLEKINSEISIVAKVCDINGKNIEEEIKEADLVLDGGDNFLLRHLINEACVKKGIPWIYSSCVSSYACSMTIIPSITPCFACIQDALPEAGDNPTCENTGIINPAVHIACAWSVSEALKILSGNLQEISPSFKSMDLWTNESQDMNMTKWKFEDCEVCGKKPEHKYLGKNSETIISLCGRGSFQINPQSDTAKPNFEKICTNLNEKIIVKNDYLIKWQENEIIGTIFKDGRATVEGISTETEARAFYDKWL